MFEVLLNDEVISGPYETAEQANDIAKSYRACAAKDQKVRIRKMPGAEEAILLAAERETQRLRDGTYVPLPDWFPTKPGLFVHMSGDREKRLGGWVALTPDNTYLLADRKVRLSASTYLARYHADDLTMTAERISALHHRLVAEIAAVNYAVVSDLETIYAAYTADGMNNESSSSRSCMAYTTFNDGTKEQHPCAVYGGDSDLHLAIGRDPDGRIVSRAVVHPGRDYFVRIYGPDASMQQGLVTWLVSQGYSRRNSFEGAQINIISCRNGVVMPYIDGEAQRVDEDGTIGHSGCYSGANTGGWAEEDRGESDDTFSCENCDDETDNDDGREVITRLNNSGTRAARTQMWCTHCRDNSTFYCERVGEYVSDRYGSFDVNLRQRTYDRSFVSDTWNENAAMELAFHCDATNEYYASHVFTPLLVRTPDGDTETWCAEANDLIEDEYNPGYGVPAPSTYEGYPHVASARRTAEPQVEALDPAQMRVAWNTAVDQTINSYVSAASLFDASEYMRNATIVTFDYEAQTATTRTVSMDEYYVPYRGNR